MAVPVSQMRSHSVTLRDPLGLGLGQSQVYFFMGFYLSAQTDLP